MNIETILHILAYPLGYEPGQVEMAKEAAREYLEQPENSDKIENV